MRGASVVVVVVLSTAACRKETIDKPVPPDMADVIRSFDAPDGTFDQATAASVKSAATDAVNGLVGSGLPQRLVDEAKAFVDKAESGGTTRTQSIHPASFEGEGFGRVTRICDGWGPADAPDEAANGSLKLTLTFTDLTIDPVVWGIAERCRLMVGPSRVFVDRVAPDAPPNVRVHLGGALAPKDIGTRPVTIAFGAHAQIDDVDVTGDFAVRITPGATAVELAVPVGDGDVVVTITGKDFPSVRAKNGTFTCDTSGCKGTAGEVVGW